MAGICRNTGIDQATYFSRKAKYYGLLSPDNLAAARHDTSLATAWSAKCYVNIRPLYQPQAIQTEAVAWKMCEKFWTLLFSVDMRGAF